MSWWIPIAIDNILKTSQYGQQYVWVYNELYLHKRSSVLSERLEVLESKSKAFVLCWEP